MSANVIHEENAPYSNTMKLILLLALLLFIMITLLSWMDVSGSREGFQIVAIVTAVVAYAYWSFFNMKFRITTEGVEASMPPFSHVVKYPNIDDVYVDKVPWWTGWGLRLWWRRIAFVSRHGAAVVVKKKSGIFRTFMLSTKDPENFARMIRDNMKRT
jgi:hypothetical protein